MSYYACCQSEAFLFYLAGTSIFIRLNSTVPPVRWRNTGTQTWRASDMTEEIIDREQLLAAFNELGVEEVDEAVSFQF